LETHKETKVTIDELKGTVHELSPRSHASLVKLVGEKCVVNLNLNGVSQEVLWDTGAKVCLVDEVWVKSHCPTGDLRGLKELFDDDLVVTSASGDTLPYVGWVEVSVNANQGRETLRVPFLVTKLTLNRPILGYNVISLLVGREIFRHF
jgi:hypothetical protein